MAGSWDIDWWFVEWTYRLTWEITDITDAELGEYGYKLGKEGAIEYANDNLSDWYGPYSTKEAARSAMNILKMRNQKNGGDLGHDYADREIEKLKRKFDEAYSKAADEMRQKLDSYLKEYDEENSRWKDMLRSGKATQEQYEAWLRSQSVKGEYLVDMTNRLAQDATRTNQLAFAMINDEIPRVYAENANFAAFDLEHRLHASSHAFDLVDESTVRALMGLDDDGQIIKEVTLDPSKVNPPLSTLRKMNVNAAKDVRWNRQKFNSAITQSILQGESIPETSRRLSQVLNMDKAMAVRAARTAMTSAENAGRVDSYKRAVRLGIKLEMQWNATFDEKTRTSHRELHGQHVPVGQKFIVPSSGHKLERPSDPTADPSEVWNCRCTLTPWSPELEDESVAQWVDLPDGTTYEEWKAGKRHGESGGIRFTDSRSSIWSNLGDNVDAGEVSAKVEELLSGAHGDASALWKRFEGQLTMYDPDYSKGAFFDPSDSGTYRGEERHRGVHMNVRRSLDNVGNRGSLSTWFHEFGHNIDNVASGWRYGWVTSSKGFGDVLKDEVDEIVKARQKDMNAQLKTLRKSRDLRGMLEGGIVKPWNRGTVDDYYDAIAHIDDDDWLRANRYHFLSHIDDVEARKDKAWDVFSEWAGVPKRTILIDEVRETIGREITKGGKATQLALGDIFEGATRGKCKDTYGHGTSYWGKRNDELGMEAFAELFSAECIYAENPDVLDKMIETLPKSYEAYRSIVRGMLG